MAVTSGPNSIFLLGKFQLFKTEIFHYSVWFKTISKEKWHLFVHLWLICYYGVAHCWLTIEPWGVPFYRTPLCLNSEDGTTDLLFGLICSGKPTKYCVPVFSCPLGSLVYKTLMPGSEYLNSFDNSEFTVIQTTKWKLFDRQQFVVLVHNRAYRLTEKKEGFGIIFLAMFSKCLKLQIMIMEIYLQHHIL